MDIKTDLIDDKDLKDVATNLYERAKDMDFMDYEDDKEHIITELENALYYIKACAQNEKNHDYFRVLHNILQLL